MYSIVLSLLLVSSLNPIKEKYELKKYDEVISSVDENSSIEDKTFKVYSLFYIGNYSEVVLMKDLSVSNMSDSLHSVFAKSYFHLGNDIGFNYELNLIKSEKYRNEVLNLQSELDVNDFLSAKLFSTVNSQGFCFTDNGKLLYAFGNKLYCGDKLIYTSNGKYVSYPFCKNGKLYFSANVLDGSSILESELSKIARDRISRMQLFEAEFADGIVSNVRLMKINNIEYDYLFPFVSESGDLYFTSNMIGGFGNYDMYRSRLENGEFMNVENLGSSFNSKLNDVGYYEFGSKVFYSSERSSIGKLDLFSCMKNSMLYGNHVNLGSKVNSRLSESNMRILSGKGYYLEMKADGTNQINIIDGLNSMTDIQVGVFNAFDLNKGVVVDRVKSDFGSGIIVDSEVDDSIIKLSVDNQFSANNSVLAKGYETSVFNNSELISNNDGRIVLKPRYYGAIEDYITGEPLSGVAVYAIKGTDTIIHFTDDKGDWWHAVDENDGWKIVFGKSGYKFREFDGEKLNPLSLRSVSMGIDSKKGSKLEIRNIYFALGKSNVEVESIEVLDRIVSYMKENPEIRFEVSAHTDSRGSDQANMKLSEQRAGSVYQYLITNGIGESRMVKKGYGESKPVNNCLNGAKCSETDFQLNRRVEIVIL